MAPSSNSTPTINVENSTLTPEALGFVVTASDFYSHFGTRRSTAMADLIAVIHQPTESVFKIEPGFWRLAYYSRDGVTEHSSRTLEPLCVAYVAAKLRGELDE